MLGIYPKGWRVPLVYRRDNEKHEILVRLMGRPAWNSRMRRPTTEPKPPQPAQPRPVKPPANSAATKYYKAKPGYANYYFNDLETKRLWAGFQKHGDFGTLNGDWMIEADWEVNNKKALAKLSIKEEKGAAGKAGRTMLHLSLGGVTFDLDPLKAGQDPADLVAPTNSGGFIMAMYHFRRLLTLGGKGFEQQFGCGGNEPYYRRQPIT